MLLKQIVCQYPWQYTLHYVIRGCRWTWNASKNISDNTRYTYFDNLLNNDRYVDEAFKSLICNVIINHDSYCINCENNILHELNLDITLSEFEDILKNLKNHMFPGIVGLPDENLKNNKYVIPRHLCDLFNAIRITSMYPDKWCEAIISSLHKKDLRVKPITTEEYHYYVPVVRFLETYWTRGWWPRLYSNEQIPIKVHIRKVNPHCSI